MTLQSSEGFGATCKSITSASVDQSGNPLEFNSCSVTTVDGSTHLLANTGQGYYMAIDGTSFRYNPSTGKTTDTSGTNTTIAPLTMTDANGNTMSISNFPNGLMSDTLGRSIPQNTVSVATSLCPNLGYSFQPVVSASQWNFPSPTGSTPITLCYANVVIRTNFWNLPGSQVFIEAGGTFGMLQSVVLPDNTYYAFQYDAADPNNSASIAYGVGDPSSRSRQ